MATTRYGLLGYPARHSKSPAMHNAAFKQAGIDAQYDAYEVAPNALAATLGGCRGVDWVSKCRNW
ncbi:hypothetical protein H7R52_16910 [Weissella confusa]|uniref:Shikimate dehydrogenase substrate binding N-terminal domain-containing protein n=1 Tax=Weissella confusa TaxID=1583 RepID=A0A923NFM0_WEICO|nr:hypothetical protein [Weissella confusa]